MAKVTLDTFDDAVRKVLEEYADDISMYVDDATKKVGQKGAIMLRNESLARFENSGRQKKGRYGTGWTCTISRSRLATVAVLHNDKYPGMPHLLENGHAKRGGGFVNGREHIAPAEAEIERVFMREVESKL